MKEVWKKIVGFDDYSVSNLGRVRRDTPTTVNPKGGNILKPRAGSKGHMYVNLFKGGSSKSQYVHRLVLFAFEGSPRSDKLCCAHNNGDPSDNRLENLRWATYAENSADSIRHGTSGRPTNSGTRHFRSKLNPEIISNMKSMVESGVSVRAVSRKFNVSHGTALNAIRGKSYRYETH